MTLSKVQSLTGIATALLLVACGENTTTEKIVEVASSGMDVVASVGDLPKCTEDNEGEQAFVKGETSARICVDGKWFATKDTLVVAGGKDTVVVAGDTVYMDGGDLSCITKELADGSGLKIICNGDSIGVVLNGKDGEQGVQGEPGVAGKDGADGKDGTDGTDGENGSDGVGCTIEQTSTLLTITCGDKSTQLNLTEDGMVAVDTTMLDSEMVAISLDEVSGVTQKGPFLMGSKVEVHEIADGRSLKQTGNSFKGKIMNDKGEFSVNARMLVSQYVALEAVGYYRNEVTGENSNSELTLFAITDVTDRNIVNVNLLTHLEYDRVNYLVTEKKMKVRDAKRQAQKEIFALLDIDATGFSNSEDLNIAGASDEDGALLAFSLMFQGDRSVATLSALLQTISNDMKTDGKWDDPTTRMQIAEWSADADSANRLDTIRGNVKGWGLSLRVPNFEQYVRNFWYMEYGLDSCQKAGVVKAATAGKRKGTKTRYICKEDGANVLRWQIADDFEKDTYKWEAGDDGEVKVGSVTGTRYYLYDVIAEKWSEASVVEQKLGGCIESVAADKSKNTGFVNGYWYKCEDRNWVRTTAYIVDTQGWVPGSDGDVQKGDSTTAYYVFDLAENKWREASANDVNLKLMGCTTNRTSEMGRSSYDNRYYSCAANHAWTLMTDKVAYNTKDFDCNEEGKMVLGTVDTKTYFVCEAGVWREATTEEEQAGEACTAGLEGHFNKDSTRICENKKFREALLYDFDVGVKNYFNSEIEYGILEDNRDGRRYKTMTINGYTIMAENLNYGDEGTHSYLIGNNWCYNNDTTNCQKGGRYYTWSAAMDIDSKWLNASVPTGTIKTQHQGICPEGWHIPNDTEWNSLFSGVGYAAQQAVGNVGWTSATNASGFSALPAGYCNKGKTNYVGIYAGFWAATESNDTHAKNWYLSASRAGLGNGFDGYYSDLSKSYGFSVRCFKDTP